VTAEVAFRPELVDPTAFIAPGAVVRGDVKIGPQSSVWFQAVLRGDTEPIRIGGRSNVQDGAVLHADPGFPCNVGDGVTIGHRAVVHGAIVEDNVVIGMGSIILNGAKIGRDSIIAAGAVVTEGSEIPPGSLALGVPAKIRRTLTPEEIEHNRHAADHYVENAKRYNLRPASGASIRGERPA
jgi:carbonic anhydrase/acetyltransferase-like protein (isoleucine patch superfamily)